MAETRPRQGQDGRDKAETRPRRATKPGSDSGRVLRNLGQRGQDKGREAWPRQMCGRGRDEKRLDVRGTLVGARCAQVGEWLH